MKTVLLLWLGSAFLTPATSTVGFQQLSVPDPAGKTLSAAVWFPSIGKPVSVSVGPFQQMVVPDGAVSGTKLPVVLISHGTAGPEGSHYDTVMALAANGFVVVALTHTGDNYRDQSYTGSQKNLSDRPRQVSVVLSYMLTTWTQHDRLDPARVGMFGVSLGGFTTLVEIGGIPDLSRTRELCTKRPTAPECLFIKQRNGDPLAPVTSTPIWTHDQRVKAAVLAAPAVSYLFGGPGSLKNVKVQVQLWRASNDEEVPDAWDTAVFRYDVSEATE